MNDDLMRELRGLREDARALRYGPDQLLEELEITRRGGETPAEAVRRVLDEARAGTAEVRAVLAEIRQELAGARGGVTEQEQSDRRAKAEDTARTAELTRVADALGMSASHNGRIDADGLRQRVLDAIGTLRESASGEVSDESPARARHAALVDIIEAVGITYVEGWTAEDMREAITENVERLRAGLAKAFEIGAQARVDEITTIACAAGLDTRDAATPEALRDLIVRRLQDIPAPAKPARGAGPRLDAVLTALGVEPDAWRTAKPEALAEMVADRTTGRILGGKEDDDANTDGSLVRLRAVLVAAGLWDPALETLPSDALAQVVRNRIATVARDAVRDAAPAGGDLDAWARGTYNAVVTLLKPVDYLAFEEGDDSPADDARARLLALLTEVKGWSESACDALVRLWSDASESYPLEYAPKRYGLSSSREEDPETLREALGDLATGEHKGLTGLDTVLTAGEDLRDVLRRFCEDWTEKSERSNDPPYSYDRDEHEAVARAVYEYLHGAGEWVTADFVLREDLIRAVDEALPFV